MKNVPVKYVEMIHINSEQYTSGSRYDGVWTLSTPVLGTYEVIYQTIDSSKIPWITSSTNFISIQYGGNPSVSFALFPDPTYLPTYQYSTDIDDIANFLQSRLNSLLGMILGYGISVTITNDTDNHRLILVFSDNLTIQWDSSSCHTIFKQSGSPVGNTFYMDTSNIDVYPHLFVHIAENTGYIIDTEPDMESTLIFHTTDTAVLGQKVVFRERTETLTIKFYRASFPETVVPLTNQWDIVLAPV